MNTLTKLNKAVDARLARLAKGPQVEKHSDGFHVRLPGGDMLGGGPWKTEEEAKNAAKVWASRHEMSKLAGGATLVVNDPKTGWSHAKEIPVNSPKEAIQKAQALKAQNPKLSFGLDYNGTTYGLKNGKWLRVSNDEPLEMSKMDHGEAIGAGEKPVGTHPRSETPGNVEGQADMKHPDAAEYEEHTEKSKLAKRLAGSVDEALWQKAKDASQDAFGKIKWPFVNWWYEHKGNTHAEAASDNAGQDVHQTDPARLSNEVRKDVGMKK